MPVNRKWYDDSILQGNTQQYLYNIFSLLDNYYSMTLGLLHLSKRGASISQTKFAAFIVWDKKDSDDHRNVIWA